MTVQKKSRRGFTLLELSIVIALVAIAVVMVSTFCIVTDHRVRESRRSLAVTNDITVTETIAEGWIELFLSQGADFSVEDQTLIAHVGEDSYKLSFALSEDKKGTVGELRGEIPTEDPIEAKRYTYTTSAVKAISFSAEEKDGRYIFFCEMLCDPTLNANESKFKKFVFCVNSHVGETFEISEVSQ